MDEDVQLIGVSSVNALRGVLLMDGERKSGADGSDPMSHSCCRA
ncbi:unnamed protein product, partial [Allacma fusca]